MVNPRMLLLLVSVTIIIGLTAINFLFPNFLGRILSEIFANVLFWVLIIIFVTFVTIPVTLLVYYYVPITNRAKLYDMLYGKGHGILRLKSKGRIIRKYIVDFNRKWTHVPKVGIFQYQDRAIYIEEGVPTITYNEMDGIVPMWETGEAINIKDDLENAISKAVEKKEFLYLNPVSYEKIKEEIKESHDPYLLENLFMQFKSTAERSAGHLIEDAMKKYMLVFFIAAGILGTMIFIGLDTTLNQLEPKVSALHGWMGTYGTDIQALKDLINAK